MKSKYIQLLQYIEYDLVTVTQCKIKIDRKIRHCGMHSHISQVKNGDSVYEAFHVNPPSAKFLARV